jgi:hypothetical protein
VSQYVRGTGPTCPACKTNEIRTKGASLCGRCNKYPGWFTADADHPVRLPYEQEWKIWQKAIGVAREKYTGPCKRKAREGRLKLVAFGDIHAPFHDRQALAELVAREGDADIALIGGDWTDAYAFSTFPKQKTVPWAEEAAALTAQAETFSETWPLVKVLRGSNHPDRFEKRLLERLDGEMIAAIRSMTGGTLAPDLALIKRFPNLEVADWTTPKGDVVPWLTVIGDVAFSHAEKYSRVPGSALRSVEDWLSDFRVSLGLPKIRVVVQFHTHQMAWVPWRSDQLLVEPGALCLTQGYQLGSRIGGRPQRLGYVNMEFVDGRVDMNSVRPFCLDWEREDVA